MENTYTFTLQYPWDSNGCRPPAAFHLRRDSNGFHMHICVTEKDPRRMETRHLHFVHEDSCVEWFVNFAPGICDRYFEHQRPDSCRYLGGFLYSAVFPDQELYPRLLRRRTKNTPGKFLQVRGSDTLPSLRYVECLFCRSA